MIDCIKSFFLSLLNLFLSIFSKKMTFSDSNITVKFENIILGEGGFSHVQQGYNASDRKVKYALKRIVLQTKEAEASTLDEIRFLKAFVHPNIVKFLGHEFVNEGDLKVAYLLFPLMRRGTLRHRLNAIMDGTAAPFSLPKLLQSFLAISKAFDVLHSHVPPYVHRDIKPENILLSEDDSPVLTDFGSVRLADIVVNTRSDALTVAEEASQFCTLPYRAPELFEPALGSHIDSRADIWGMGCLFYAYRFGYSPFECDYNKATDRMYVVESSFLRILGGKLPRPSVLKEEDSVVLELATDMVNPDMQKRPFTRHIIERVHRLLGESSSATAFQHRGTETV